MSAWIAGEPTDYDRAIDAAAELLGESFAPVVAGLVTDYHGACAAYRFAAEIGAFVDPLAAGALYADLGRLGAAGSFATTPAETVGRADAIVAIGARAMRHPCLETAIVEPVRGRAEGRSRASHAFADGDETGRWIVHRSGPYGLAGAVGRLRGVMQGRLPEADLAALASVLREASYIVFAYEAEELGELGIAMLQGLASELNETTRAFTLSLPDDWQGGTVLQAAIATVGQPPRTGFGSGHGEHDPWRFDAARALAEGEADAALWIAALAAPLPAWSHALPTVALIGGAQGEEARIVFDVARPALDRDGIVWDARKAGLAFAVATASSALPAVATVIDDIARAGAGKLTAC